MSPGRNWREVKAETHLLHPELADPQRQAAADAQLDAYVAGHHLKELRKSVGKTQSEVAAALGISQARVSQIENGRSGFDGARDHPCLRGCSRRSRRRDDQRWASLGTGRLTRAWPIIAPGGQWMARKASQSGVGVSRPTASPVNGWGRLASGASGGFGVGSSRPNR
ncbi:helix-turn-helix domain-containing protein [Nonomuraea angiospora]